MHRITVASAALNQVPLDWRGNVTRILQAIEMAKQENASVLCLPELCVSGYGCADAFYSAWVAETSWRKLEEIAPHTSGMVVCIGLPVRIANNVFNGVAFVVDGIIRGVVTKRSMASGGVHYEDRWFVPVPAGTLLEHESGVLVGELRFSVGGVVFEIEVCRDAWMAASVARSRADLGVDILLNPSASHSAVGKLGVRRTMAIDSSRACGCCVVYSNLLGCEAGRVVFDGDSRIVSEGAIVAEVRAFSLREVEIVTAVVDIEVNRARRMRQLGGGSGEACLVDVAFDLPRVEAGACSPIQVSEPCRNTFFAEAASLGLLDYMTKSRSHGFVVSLSGGVDSGAVTVLATLSLRRLWRELGREEAKERLSYLKIDWSEIDSVDKLLSRLVTTVYQATSNSSEGTLEAATCLAKGLGVSFHVWNIDSLVSEYTKLVEAALGVSLSWSTDDLVLQNIQPRVRVPGVWMLANHKRALLLATGNRSEAALGYCTMDGDTAGGFNPIAGVSKYFLLAWLRWLEVVGLAGVGRMECLSKINEQVPSAELRPKESRQTDEDDLMPYEVIDSIETLVLIRRQSPIDVVKDLFEKFGEKYSRDQLTVWVKVYFTKWAQSQWKRERLAVGLHLDECGVDAHGWCRFPALNSGFEEELENI